MKKNYGLISFIFGTLSLSWIILPFAPLLSVFFAILHKAKGNPEDRHERIFARMGFILGTAMQAVSIVAFAGEVLIFSRTPFLDCLPFLFGAVAVASCVWLYKRNWKNRTAPNTDPIVSNNPPSLPKQTCSQNETEKHTAPPSGTVQPHPVQEPSTPAEPLRTIRQTDVQPNLQFIHELFRVEMESWVYIDFVGLDARNGKAYYVHSAVRNIGGAYGTQEYYREISYDQVREYADRKSIGNTYRNLNANTWRDFIPSSKLAHIAGMDAQNPVTLQPVKSSMPRIAEFFMEIHNGHFHTITWLRKTPRGYRLFYIASKGWTGGLPFRFQADETMLDEIFQGKHGYSLDAYDRPLSAAEANAVLSLADKDSENAKPIASYAKGYYIRSGLCCACTTNQWEHYSHTLSSIAKQGCKLEEPGENKK